MYCSNCGSKSEDNSTICVNCGAKQSEDSQHSLETNPPKTTKELKKPFFITIAAITGLTVILLIIGIISDLTAKNGAKSPEKAAEIYFEATFERNSEKLMWVMSPYAKNEIMNNSDGYPIDDERLKAYIENRMNHTESNIKLLDIKCTVTKNYSYDELNSVRNKYYNSYGKGTESYGTITDFVSLEVFKKLRYKGNVITDTSIVQACCIDDRWYILSF